MPFARKIMLMTLMAGAAAGLLGCSSSTKDNGPGNPEKEPEASAAAKEAVNLDPVTLKMFVKYAALTDLEFQNFFADPVKRKYPNITLEIVRPAQGADVNDLVAAGQFPDLVYIPHARIDEFMKLDLLEDLNGLIKTSGMDLNKFDPVTIEGIRQYGDKGQTYAIPFSVNFSALFYNKDLFDKFSVPYPKDKMSWDDVIELGKKLARTENGIPYKAINVGGLVQFASQLSLPYSEPKTDKPLMSTDGWVKALTYYKMLNDIPGNSGASLDNFFKDKTEAMYAGVGVYTIGMVEDMRTMGIPFNWDLVSYPNFKESAGKSMGLDEQTLSVSATSKNKTQAFQVISLVTDDENQLSISRNGRISSLKDVKFKTQFGVNVPSLQGKNLQGIFLNTPAATQFGPYYNLLRPFLDPASKKVLNENADINSALREANEAGAQAIAKEKSGQK